MPRHPRSPDGAVRPTRSRILLLLDRHELTVSELCSIMQLPRSTASRHLKALVDGGWIAARAEGGHLYTMTRDDLDAAATGCGCWSGQVGPTPAAAQDHRRLGRRSPATHEIAGVLLFVCESVGSPSGRAVRRSRASGSPGRARRQRMGGGRSRLRCRSSSAALAPFVGNIIAVDSSAAVPGRPEGWPASTTSISGAASSKRRRRRSTRRGRDDARAAPCAEPAKAVADVARTLKPGGHHHRRHAAARPRELPAADGTRLSVLRRPCQSDAHQAGLGRIRIVSLTPDARQRPELFVATARSRCNRDGPHER